MRLQTQSHCPRNADQRRSGAELRLAHLSRVSGLRLAHLHGICATWVALQPDRQSVALPQRALVPVALIFRGQGCLGSAAADDSYHDAGPDHHPVDSHSSPTGASCPSSLLLLPRGFAYVACQTTQRDTTPLGLSDTLRNLRPGPSSPPAPPY